MQFFVGKLQVTAFIGTHGCRPLAGAHMSDVGMLAQIALTTVFEVASELQSCHLVLSQVVDGLQDLVVDQDPAVRALPSTNQLVIATLAHHLAALLAHLSSAHGKAEANAADASL